MTTDHPDLHERIARLMNDRDALKTATDSIIDRLNEACARLTEERDAALKQRDGARAVLDATAGTLRDVAAERDALRAERDEAVGLLRDVTPPQHSWWWLKLRDLLTAYDARHPKGDTNADR